MTTIRQELRRDKMERERRTRRRRILLLVFVLLLAAVLVLLWRYLSGHSYGSCETVSEYALSSSVTALQDGEHHLLLCGSNGTKALDRDGKVLWEVAYEMEEPRTAVCGAVTAIADIGGTSVYVVGENGIPYTYRTIYPIVAVAVAKQGVTAVLLDNGTEDYIQIYDKNGSLRVDINTKTKTDGFPVGMALSEDGKKLVTLYLTFEGDQLVSKITFYNAGEVGKNYIGNIVGQKSYSGTFVGGVCFLDNDTVCMIKEDGFALYRMKEMPEMLVEETTKDRLVDLVCAEGSLVMVTEEAQTKKRTAVRYGADGKRKTVWTDLPEYEQLHADRKEILLFSPYRAVIYRNNRTVKLDVTFDRPAEGMFFAEGNRYFLVDMEKARTVKLSETKQTEGEDGT